MNRHSITNALSTVARYGIPLAFYTAYFVYVGEVFHMAGNSNAFIETLVEGATNTQLVLNNGNSTRTCEDSQYSPYLAKFNATSNGEPKEMWICDPGHAFVDFVTWVTFAPVIFAGSMFALRAASKMIVNCFKRMGSAGERTPLNTSNNIRRTSTDDEYDQEMEQQLLLPKYVLGALLLCASVDFMLPLIGSGVVDKGPTALIQDVVAEINVLGALATTSLALPASLLAFVFVLGCCGWRTFGGGTSVFLKSVVAVGDLFMKVTQHEEESRPSAPRVQTSPDKQSRDHIPQH